MFNELNKKNTIPSDCDTSSIIYGKLSDYKGMDLHPLGYLINDTRYGKSVTVIIKRNDKYEGVSLPSRYAADFESFTTEQVDALLSGHLMISNIRDLYSKNGKTVVFDYCDI